METFTIYTVPELSKPEFGVSSPYCRETFKKDNCVAPLRLLVSNPSKLLSLIEKLTDDSSKALEIKINKYLIKEANCKFTFLIHLRPLSEEIVVQTLGTEELETSLRFPISESAVEQLILFKDKALKCDETLNAQIRVVFKKVLADLSCNIISVPILQKQNYYPCSTQNIKPILLVCFINSDKEEDFLIRIANELFKFCLPVFLNKIVAEEETRQKRQYESLLAITSKLFANVNDLNGLLKILTNETKNLTNAQKCSLFLTNLDHVHLVSKIYDTSILSKTKKINVKMPTHDVISDHVARTGELMNIQSHCDVPLINNNLSEFKQIETKNILCLPIKNERELIGVIQLCNKRGGSFTQFDEKLATALSSYGGLAIMQSLRHTQIKNCHIRNQLSNEIMMYYINVDEEEAVKKMSCPLIHVYTDFDRFTFSPRIILQMETVCFVLKMFEDLGFFKTFSIKRNVLTRFIVYVQKSCNEIPYHNWMHLFATAHFAYLLLKNLQLVEKEYITELEALAYFVSCLCHDVDYRGTNNSFKEMSNTTLASLYSSSGSVMERHRLSQVLRILNTEGCNFLEVLDCENYKLFLCLLKDFILATDLATHFKFYGKQYGMTQEGYNNENPEHRYIFVNLLVTCADLSDHTKDWRTIKAVAYQMYEEFVTLGDLLVKTGDKSLTTKIDRERAFLPDLQIEFLKKVCLPSFKLLAVMFPEVKEVVRQIKRNILYWESSKHILYKAIEEGQTYEQVLKSEQFDKDLEATWQRLENVK